MATEFTNPLKFAGGKSYLAKRIVSLMVPHRHYVEPFAGGLAVLLERDPNDPKLWLSNESGQSGVSEVVNDINGDLTNFYRVLRDKDTFADFKRMCDATPLSRHEFNLAGDILQEPFPKDPFGDSPEVVLRAWAFFVRCRQSRAGGFKAFTSLTRSRTRRGINGNASEWLGAVEGLAAVHARLRPVVIENMPAVDLIIREDAAGTLVYADPPYVHSTRASTDLYSYEMSEADHVALLCVLTDPSRKSKFMISGYCNELYDKYLINWSRYDFDIANHNAGGDTKRRMVECLWCNW